ncbi:MAG: hypothetical protein IKY83_02325 [Proteobacteria bacterium]|nr:hypothetical protein [Pseudomonadota bacterium]
MLNIRLPELYNAPYIIGIGGIGLAGVARLLRDLGRPVAGTDLRASEITQMLEADGVPIEIGDCQLEKLKTASCVITPVTMGVASKVWIYCMTHQIPVCNKVQALADILSAARVEPVYVLGSTSRAKTARMISEAAHFGWIAGLVPLSGETDVAHFERRMAVELDDPYIHACSKSLERFPEGDFVISDFQFEDYDHYGRGMTDVREIVDRIRREKRLAGRCLVIPRQTEAPDQLAFRIVRDDDFDHAEICQFRFDARYVYPPASYHASPAPYDGTRADASGLAAAWAWLYARGCAQRPCDIPSVGWFETVAQNAVLDIRMHPYHVALSLDAARLRARGRRLRVVFKPFASVLERHSGEYWCKAFQKADDLYIVLPGYEGVSDAQADQFVKSLRDGMETPEVHDCSLAAVYRLVAASGAGDFWVWFGAPDILEGV